MKQITPPILTAATGLLQPFYPELTPQGLLSMLNAEKSEKQMERPLTRQQAAALLSVSLPTLDRYLKTGLLRATKLGPRNVRINPQSLRELLTGGWQGE